MRSSGIVLCLFVVGCKSSATGHDMAAASDMAPTCMETIKAHKPRPAPTWTRTSITTNSSPSFHNRMAAITDVTGDGRDDIVTLTWDYDAAQNPIGETRVFRNDGGGKFSEVTSSVVPGGFVPSGPRRIIPTTVDGQAGIFVAQDGYDNDCSALPCRGASDALLLVAGGQLADHAPTLLTPYDVHGFTHAAAAADADGDGHVDLYEGRWPNFYAPALVHLQMRRGATFAAEDTRLPSDVASGTHPYSSAAFCDVDGDKMPDLVLGGAGVNDRLLVNDGSGHFADSSKPAPAGFTVAATDYVLDIACVDYDLDGANDLAILSGGLATLTTMQLHLLHNDGSGGFTDVNVTQTLGPLSMFQVWPRDFNCDGWPDLLVSMGTTPDSVERLYINDGKGNFTESIMQNGPVGTWIYPIDVDGDGRVALYSAEQPDMQFLYRPQ